MFFCPRLPAAAADVAQGTGPIPRNTHRYLLLFCHRGQFSNRILCMQRGIRVARALQRRLVFPIFTDGPDGPVDSATYLDMTCFR